MFGHQNNTNSQDNAVQHGSDAPADNTMSGLEPETIAPTASSAPAVDDSSISSYVVTDLPEPSADDTASSLTTASAPASPPVIPHSPSLSSAPQTTPPPVSLPASPLSSLSGASSSALMTPPATTPEASDLIKLKQMALHELSPLLGHLDQTPEEKFRTTMMMIQAADDHTMLQAAHDAAKSIHDEKARAQALLDVVNEINYFTQASTEAISS